MKQQKILLSTVIFTLFLGCSSKDANHILVNPISVITNSIENANYNSRREKVEAYAQLHYDVLKQEVYNGSGQHLNEIMRLANIKKSNYAKVQKQLQKDYKVIFKNSQSVTERIVQSFSQLYMPKKETKKRNGFTYTEVYNIVQNHVNHNFETMRFAVKHHQTTELEKLATKLHITESQKREKFIHSLDEKYFQLYVDPLVVSLMIHGV